MDGSLAIFFVKGRKSAIALQRVSGRLTLPDNSKVIIIIIIITRTTRTFCLM